MVYIRCNKGAVGLSFTKTAFRLLLYEGIRFGVALYRLFPWAVGSAYDTILLWFLMMSGILWTKFLQFILTV